MKKRSGTVRLGMLVALLLMGCPAGMAQTVYKCHDAYGRSRYQATPCATGSTQVWRREMEAAPVMTAPLVAHAHPVSTPATLRSSGKPGVRRQAPQGAVISLHRDAAACARTKAQRDRALARRGLKRTFLELRRWDERVHEACR